VKIKSLHIENFKSIVDITIDNPNPFTVFVGANGSGKSNIFEALETMFLPDTISLDLMGGINMVKNKNSDFNEILIEINFALNEIQNLKKVTTNRGENRFNTTFLNASSKIDEINTLNEKVSNFSRIFIKNSEKQKIKFTDDSKLTFSCSNLEKVLKRILEDESKSEEISDWLSLFIPEFDRIEVQKSPFSSNEDLLIYQKHYYEPFNKDLISDGTYNIIALLTAVFQSDDPQFLCIEEPENGLNPKVIKELVNFFRDACEQYGHYIWLNTHSQTLVSVLEPKELILVDKKEGETKIKQFGLDFNLHGFTMDDAWFTNALGGGMPW
jgi:predicted ATPase